MFFGAGRVLAHIPKSDGQMVEVPAIYFGAADSEAS